MCLFSLVGFFFFKQKTAYEMLISDWSSDVCSYDLHQVLVARMADADAQAQIIRAEHLVNVAQAVVSAVSAAGFQAHVPGGQIEFIVCDQNRTQIGRAVV